MSVQSDPCERGFAITPNDDENLEAVTRGVYVGASGALKVTLDGGSTITLPAVNAGAIYPLRVRKVFATGTTATGLHGLY